MPPSCDGPTTTLLKHGQWWRRSVERNRRRSRVHRRYPVTLGLRLNKTASRRVGLSFNPIAVGFAEEDHCRYQRTFAQSPSRFDTATFQLGLPYLRDAGPLPQVALSDLQRLVVEPIVCEPFRWPSGCLLRQCWPLGEATPKLLVRPCQAQLRT